MSTIDVAKGLVSGINANTLDGVDSTGFAKAGGNAGALTIGTNDASALTLETNGTPRVTVDANGNVGIGAVADASNKLLLSSAGALNTTSDLLALELSGGYGKSYLQQYYGSGSAGWGSAFTLKWNSGIKSSVKLNAENSVSGNAGNISFITSDNERMRITSSGNIGIGNTGTSQSLLTIGSDNSSKTILSGYWSSANTTNTLCQSHGSGSMGIGYGVKCKPSVASPDTGVFSSSYGLALPKCYLDIGYGGNLTYLTAPQTTNAVDSDVTLTPKFTITNTGNVGIGTSSPSAKLQVSDSSSASGSSLVVDRTGAVGSTNLELTTLHSTNYDRYFIKAKAIGANVTAFSVNHNGDVGVNGNVLIGTTTDNGVDKLQVNGGIRAAQLSVGQTSVSKTVGGIGNAWISTGISVNGSFGGKLITVLASANASSGNNTSAVFAMIRCGFDGDNHETTIISSDLQAGGGLTTRVVSGILELNMNVTGNSKYRLDSN